MKKIIIFTILFLMTFNVANAGLVPAECAGEATLESCNLDAVEKTIIGVVEYLLGIAGSLALLMFVYGGLMYILGGADEKLLSQGKNALKYAVIGLVIVLTAGVAMRTIIDILA
jgi:hypothetical protein